MTWNSTLSRSKSLPRGGYLKRSKLSPVSKKRKKQQGQRAKCMKVVRARAGGKCEVCGGVGVDGHEKLMRSQGGSITDPANVILVCRDCHSQIHASPERSYASG